MLAGGFVAAGVAFASPTDDVSPATDDLTDDPLRGLLRQQREQVVDEFGRIDDNVGPGAVVRGHPGEAGDSFDLGSRTITEDDIVEFATQYDPQPFHVDPEAAAGTRYGQLFASGWHTAAVCMRQLVDGLFADTAVVSGVGVDELRWERPVYGGDELAVAARADTEIS